MRRTRSLFLPVALVLLGPVAPLARADWAEGRKQFLSAQKDGDWKARRAAYQALVDYDGADAVETILSGLGLETHPAVLAAGVDVLGRLRSGGAKKAAADAARKGKAQERVYAVLALSAQRGTEVDAALAEAAAGPNAQVAAQAALVLGQPGRVGALAALMPLLSHREWQVREAAARGLSALADRAALKPLAERLGAETGTARGAIVKALEAISKQKLGDAPAKWKAVADGTDPAAVKEAAHPPPTAFGIPITGQRVVFVLDRSLLMDDQHPFERKRLEELCTPPEGDRIPWYRLATKLQFATAHLKHAVEGLPPAAKFEVIHFCKDVKGLFEMKLVPANAGNKKALVAAIDALKADNGVDIYDALTAALDVAGGKEDAAWKSGPDEILFVTNNLPTFGEIKGTDADAIAPAIGLKARLRMVTIHAVGIANHPFSLAEGLAARTGGTYLSLLK